MKKGCAGEFSYMPLTARSNAIF